MTCRILLISTTLLFTIMSKAQTEKDKLLFWNYKLPIEQRVNDVVSRLTLEEKVAQMLNSTPAITRLNIPATTGGMKCCMVWPALLLK